MVRFVPLLAVGLLSGSALAAQDPQAPLALPLACEGNSPDWRLDLSGPVARFRFSGATEMEIPLRTRAEGRDWPRALTLIGERDTAIVVLHDRACGIAQDSFPIEAQILTQRGQTPVLLTGCCAVTE